MTKGIKVNDPKKDLQQLPESKNEKSMRRSKFAKMLTAASALFALGGCGDSSHDLSSAPVDAGNADVVCDGGIINRHDGGAVQEDAGTVVKKCDYSTYMLFKIGEENKAVMEGASVAIGGKKYVANMAQDGSVVLHSGNEYYVVRDTATINGVEVSYLGSGTTLTNAALLQVEYFSNGKATVKSAMLSKGERMTYLLDGEHYVEVTLEKVLSASKNGDQVKYVVVGVKLFVQSRDDDNTFISAKEGTYTVGVEGAKGIVVDEETGLAVNIDLLGVGTDDAVAKLSINGKEANLKYDGTTYTVKVNNVSVSIGVVEAFYSDGVSRATLLISSPTRAILVTMNAGEKVNLEVDDSGQRLHIEMLGCEPVCKAE